MPAKPAPQPSETSVLTEELAELEHEQWEVWSRSLISQLLDDITPFETVKIRNRVLAKHQRWLKLWKPYSELTEEEKEQDRIWARKVEACVLEKKNAEIDVLRGKINPMEIDLSCMREACSAMEKEIDALKITNNTLRKVNKDMENIIRELEQENAELKKGSRP